MMLMQNHQGGLWRRLSVVGIPKVHIGSFIDLIVRWESCSGVEWTIKRLKSLKVDLIRRQSGLSGLTWIRKNRRGDVAGTIGSLFRWADKSEMNFARCVQAFMAYTYYVLPSLTDSQKEKFLRGINPEEGDTVDKVFLRSLSRTVSRAIRKRRIHRLGSPLVIYRGSPDKKAPMLWGRKSVHQNENILADLGIFNTSFGLYLYQKYERLFKPLLKGIGARRRWLDWIASQPQSDPVTLRCGEIHFLQEPGGKLRSVASPFRIFQEVLRPMGDELYRLVRSLPWDCTFNQEKATPFIQSHLKQGGQVHSVDLSSATDLFPLSVQETVLRTVFHKQDWDHVNLFLEISRGEWKSPIGNLQWTKGQPLGLFPSFATFTLSHGLLLLHLAGSYNNQFFVVGDDVIILDDQLRERYISMLDLMNCPWSEDKSITSNSLSEFAGKIVTSSMVIPQLKWRQVSDDNFLDVCRLLGSRSRCLLNWRQKRVFDKVAHLCDPIGLNFSLPGDNLATMVERTLDFYHPEKDVLGALMGLRGRINRLVYSPFAEDLNADELHEISATFDEKVKSALKQTIFNRWETAVSIGLDGLASLPEALGTEPRLPLRDLLPSRVTTLGRYERLLSQQRASS